MNDINDSEMSSVYQAYFDGINNMLSLDVGVQDDVHVLRDVINTLKEMDSNYTINGHLSEVSRLMLREIARDQMNTRRIVNCVED